MFSILYSIFYFMKGVIIMEEYKPNVDLNDKNEEKYEKRTIERSIFQESALNNTMPIWMKLTFFLMGWLGFKFLSLILQAMFLPLYTNKIIDASTFNALMMLVVYGVLAVLFSIFFVTNRKVGKAFLNDWKDWKAISMGFAVFIVSYMIEVILNVIFSKAFPAVYGANTNQSGLSTYMKASPIMMFFPIVLFAPFTEELTYRIGLVDSLGSKNRWVGIIVSAIIFGLIHFSFESIFYYTRYDDLLKQSSSVLQKSVDALGNITYYTKEEMRLSMLNEFLNLPTYICAGLVFSFGYAFTGKISTSMTAHITNNLLSFIMMLISANTTTNCLKVMIK